MFNKLKNRWQQLKLKRQIKRLQRQAAGAHGLRFAISGVWLLIFLVVAGTFYGVYKARHWQWGVLDKIPVISRVFNGSDHGSNSAPPGQTGGSLGNRSGRGSGSHPFGSPQVHTVPVSGYMHTSGTQILDGNNRVVRLFSQGNSRLDQWGSACKARSLEDDPNYLSNLKSWGFNSVYLTFSWAALEPTAPTFNADGSVTHHFNQGYLARYDAAVAAYKAKGIAVIFKMNAAWAKSGNSGCVEGMPTWIMDTGASGSVDQSACNFISNIKDSSRVPGRSPQDNMAEMWRAFITRYKGNSTVIGVDPINEPYVGNYKNCSGYNLAGLYRIAGAKISEANPNLLLMFQEASMGEATRSAFPLSSAPPFANVVHVMHLYASGWDTAGAGNECSFDRAGGAALQNVWAHAGAGFKVPIWIQEFNSLCYKAGNRDEQWSADMDKFMAFIKDKQLSFGVTSYSGPNGIVDDDGLEQAVLDKLKQGF